MSKKYEKFVKFREAYKLAHPDQTKQVQFDKATEIWNEVKSCPDKIEQKLLEFKLKTDNIKAKKLNFWVKFQTGASSSKEPTVSTAQDIEIPKKDVTKESNTIEADNKNLELKSDVLKRSTPAQDKLKKEIDVINGQIADLKKLQNTGWSEVTNEQFKKLYDQREAKEKKLRKMQKDILWQKTNRENTKLKIQKVCDTNPEAAEILKSCNRSVQGRPRIEVDQPQLLSTILDIVEASSAADSRRRSEMMRSVQTLDELKNVSTNIQTNFVMLLF